MRKTWVVIRREFVERVRTKWFIIGTVLGPVFMGLVMVLPILMAERGAERRTVVVVDATTDGFGERLMVALGQTGSVVSSRLAVAPFDLERAADSLARAVGVRGRDVPLDGLLLVTDATPSDGRAEYRGANVTSPADMRILQGVLRGAVFAERLRREGVEPDVVGRAQIQVELATVKIRDGKATGESGESSFFLAYLIWFLLYMAILLYGVQVMGSVVEEKASRIVEVLISSLKPFHLLAGKVVGVGAVGLLQMGIWLGAGKLLLDRREDVVRLIGKPEAAAAVGQMALPQVPFATIVLFLAYFLLGYFLYAAMFAAVAAMVNTEAEARQAQTPVVMLLVIPTVMMIGILNNPDGSMALTLSLVPFTSPIAMPVRWAAAPVPLAQVGQSLAFLVATVIAITWVAGRIYRVGILAYGKKPGLRELVRWVKG
jgi:ABC-2 type transport system permease protein